LFLFLVIVAFEAGVLFVGLFSDSLFAAFFVIYLRHVVSDWPAQGGQGNPSTLASPELLHTEGLG